MGNPVWVVLLNANSPCRQVALGLDEKHWSYLENCLKNVKKYKFPLGGVAHMGLRRALSHCAELVLSYTQHIQVSLRSVEK